MLWFTPSVLWPCVFACCVCLNLRKRPLPMYRPLTLTFGFMCVCETVSSWERESDSKWVVQKWKQKAKMRLLCSEDEHLLLVRTKKSTIAQTKRTHMLNLNLNLLLDWSYSRDLFSDPFNFFGHTHEYVCVCVPSIYTKLHIRHVFY